MSSATARAYARTFARTWRCRGCGRDLLKGVQCYVCPLIKVALSMDGKEAK